MLSVLSLYPQRSPSDSGGYSDGDIHASCGYIHVDVYASFGLDIRADGYGNCSRKDIHKSKDCQLLLFRIPNSLISTIFMKV